MAEKKRVLITGGAGKVGSTLWGAWEKEDKYTLTLVDIKEAASTKSRVELGDVRDYQRMRELCKNQDVVVHLALVNSNQFGKVPGEVTDIGASMLLFEAAREEGVQKIVFASTNHVTGWNEHISSPPRFSTAEQINPDGWYGAMKGMAEVAGRYLVNEFNMRFISVRIGTFTGGYEAEHLRTCSTLLTPRDCAQLFGRAVDYEGPVKFLITYGRSANSTAYQQSYLDISGAVEILGYQPQDNLMKTHLPQLLADDA